MSQKEPILDTVEASEDDALIELTPQETRQKTATLLFSIMIIATNGVIYELLIGGYSSYLLGDSITQFSLTIGLFMSSMGIGSWLTQFFDKHLERRFIEVELWLAVLGGPAVLILSMAHIHTRVYSWIMFGMIILLGTLIGFEIPMVTRIVNRYGSLKKSLANVLSFDYIGALFGSLVFPLLLLPELGFARTSFLIGWISLLIGMLNLHIFREELGARVRVMWFFCVVIGISLTVGLIYSADWLEKAREKASGQKLVFLHHSSYQNLRFVRDTNRHGQHVHRLYINGEHQFSTDSEHQYHEMLVHPAIAAARQHRRILVLGGGDGLVLRELWKYKDIQKVVLVDLDPTMVRWARKQPIMRKLHKDAFDDPRLTILHQDAFLFASKRQKRFDVIIMDLPVATNVALSKLYSASFFRRLKGLLHKDGAVVTEAAVLDPIEKKPFWCLVRTMRAAGWHVHPYVESTMAYTLMTQKKVQVKSLSLKTKKTRYVRNWLMRSAFALTQDVQSYALAPINTLDTHALLGLVLALR